MSSALVTEPSLVTLAQAQAHERAGQWVQAESAYRALVAANPRCHEAWHALGLLAFNAGRVPQAIQCIEEAIAANPGVALYHRNVGEMYRRLGQLDKATTAGLRATRLAPCDLDAHYNLALAYSDARDHERAVQGYRQALTIRPDHGLSWNNLGSALGQQGAEHEALQAYLRAIELNPRHAEAQCNAGAVYVEQGQLALARACFEAAIAVRPEFIEAHYNLSSLKTYTPADSQLAMMEALYIRREQLSPHLRIRLGFALGKALEDIGQHDRAFAAYEEGNRLQHAQMPVDEQAADALLDRLLAVFDADFFEARRAWRGAQAPGRTPIFIVGMPRSGTTLLEQILSSHPGVHGAGELKDLNESIDQATGAGPGRSFVDGVAALAEADMRRLGLAYLDRLWARSPGSCCITDKMPGNFFYLGLIHLALPGARIIHAMRDPMDSCFSCYGRLFNDTMAFTYDQRSLGRYHARYQRLMAHWHRVLPPGMILDLPYEAMVADTEAQTRRVLAHLGLPWDPACLDFHLNGRVVKTASVAQVRKPIYQTSVARWRPFARHLQPLSARRMRPPLSWPACRRCRRNLPGHPSPIRRQCARPRRPCTWKASPTTRPIASKRPSTATTARWPCSRTWRRRSTAVASCCRIWAAWRRPWPTSSRPFRWRPRWPWPGSIWAWRSSSSGSSSNAGRTTRPAGQARPNPSPASSRGRSVPCRCGTGWTRPCCPMPSGPVPGACW